MIGVEDLRMGLLIGQLGFSGIRELIGLFIKTGATLPEIAVILADIGKDQKAADAAADMIEAH